LARRLLPSRRTHVSVQSRTACVPRTPCKVCILNYRLASPVLCGKFISSRLMSQLHQSAPTANALLGDSVVLACSKPSRPMRPSAFAPGIKLSSFGAFHSFTRLAALQAKSRQIAPNRGKKLFPASAISVEHPKSDTLRGTGRRSVSNNALTPNEPNPKVTQTFASFRVFRGPLLLVRINRPIAGS
jgi:hypothetical protein